METLTDLIPTDISTTQSTLAKPVTCLSCGTDKIKPGRRYCSKRCREQINWVLSLSKGLLKAFNARYAAYSFTRGQVVLDVLPTWSKGISRFSLKRTPGNKPAEDLKNLILMSGNEWYKLVDNNLSKSSASLSLINKNHKKEIDPTSIKPKKKVRPRLSKDESAYLKLLHLDRKDLSLNGDILKIKSAYKKMAKLCHPDIGGKEEEFKKINEAHEQMLLWAENPHYTSKKALRNSWSYDGFTNRWSPPL